MARLSLTNFMAGMISFRETEKLLCQFFNAQENREKRYVPVTVDVVFLASIVKYVWMYKICISSPAYSPLVIYSAKRLCS